VKSQALKMPMTWLKMITKSSFVNTKKLCEKSGFQNVNYTAMNLTFVAALQINVGEDTDGRHF
jgi:hypothetical protein